MAKLCVIEGPMKGIVFVLEGEVFFIGRSPSNDIHIHDETVSRRHLKIFTLMDSYFVEDLKSKNGTFVNGRPIEPGQGIQVNDKDIISLGFTKLRLDEIPAPKAFPSGVSNSSPERHAKKVVKSLPDERRARSSREMGLVQEIMETLKSPVNIEDFFQKLLEILLAALPRIDRAAILLFNEGGDEIKKAYLKPRANGYKGKVGYSKTIVEQMMKEKEPIVLQHILPDELPANRGSGDTLEIKSVLCVPMKTNERLYGALYLDGLIGSHAFRKDDLLLIRTLSDLSTFALENSSLSDRMGSIKKILTESA